MMRNAPHCDNWISRRLRANCGQALIETALVVPFLMMILVGGVELARVEYASIEVANAAKAAVQYGAQGLGTIGDWAGMQTAAQQDSHNITLTSFNHSSAYECLPGGTFVATAGSCSSSSTTVKVLYVDITANFYTLLDFPGIPSTITLHGHATQIALEGQ